MPFLLNKSTNEKLELNSSWVNIGNVSEADIRINAAEIFLFTIENKSGEFFIERKKGNLALNNQPFLKSRLSNGSEIMAGNLLLLFFEHNENDEEESGFAIPEFNFIDKENEKFIQDLLAVNNFARQINSITELETLLNVTLQLAATITGSEKAFLMLGENTGNSPVSLKATLNLENELSSIDNLSRFFLNLIGRNLSGNNSVSFDSINNSFFPAIRNIIILKLSSGDEVNGYLGLINQKNRNEEKAVFIAESLAAHSAIAIGNSLRLDKVKREASTRNNLQRHVSREVATDIIKNRREFKLNGEALEGSVILSRIQEFHLITARLKPETVINILNEFFSEMTRIVFSFNGSVDKYLGEGLLALFGLPFATPEHTVQAVQAAIKMRQLSEKLKEKYISEYGLENFNVRFAVSTGSLVYGNAGSPQRIDLRITGEPVYEAFLAEQAAKDGCLVITEEVMKKGRGIAEYQSLEPMIIRDRRLSLFEVLSGSESLNHKDQGASQVRRFVRISVKTFVTVMKDGIRGHGLIRDISAGGLKIGLTGSYRVGDKISLTFLLSNKYSFRNISGIVKYIEKPEISSLGLKDSRPHIILGVEFEKPEPAVHKQLITFINEEREKQL